MDRAGLEPVTATDGGWQAAAAAALDRRTARGQRIVLIADNDARTLDIVLAALRTGRIPVLLNPRLTTDDLDELTADADPSLVVTDGRPAPRTGPAAATTIEELTADTGGQPPPLSPWPLARPMHYTSGTTGRSKGVYSGVLTEQAGRFLCEEERELWGFAPTDVHLVCSSLSHSAPTRFALNTLVYGGRVVVLPSFDTGQFLELVEREGVTTTFVTPTHLARLLDDPGFDERDLSSLRLVAHAGAPCPPSVKRRVTDRLPEIVWEFYGSTEGQFTALSPEEWEQRPWSVGRARPGRELRVVEEGRVVEPGEVATIWSTCPAPARFSYWRDADKTAATWRQDIGGEPGPWFSVGDLGSMDEHGFLQLVGRRTDLIITGGVNVYPAQVERVLNACPGVAEGVVFGVPDPEWGQRVCAAVVATADTALDAEQVRRWLRERLAGFQTPKEIRILGESLPRTATGKLLRRQLADRFAAHSPDAQAPAVQQPCDDRDPAGGSDR